MTGAKAERMVAVDCEMCCTAEGLELCRATLVDDTGQVGFSHNSSSEPASLHCYHLISPTPPPPPLSSVYHACSGISAADGSAGQRDHMFKEAAPFNPCISAIRDHLRQHVLGHQAAPNLCCIIRSSHVQRVPVVPLDRSLNSDTA